MCTIPWLFDLWVDAQLSNPSIFSVADTALIDNCGIAAALIRDGKCNTYRRTLRFFRASESSRANLVVNQDHASSPPSIDRRQVGAPQ